MHPLVILIDVDDTLLDGDHVRASITASLDGTAGAEVASAFWSHYEAVRAEFGGVDVPEAARRLEVECGLAAGSLAATIEAVDFAPCLCAGAIAALVHLGTLGLTVVLSDGDAHFQRAKIASAGITAAVQGRVLIVPHKEHALDLVTSKYPAAHYAILDDREAILSAVKAQLGERVTTVHVLQGRYAQERPSPAFSPPDLDVSSIAATLALDARALLGNAEGPPRP